VDLFIAYILSSGREFVRGIRANRKRVHRMGDEVADALQHRAMSRQPRQPRKAVGHDQQREMPAARGRTGMAGRASMVPATSVGDALIAAP
jgi:hypothetical protein